MGAKSLSETKGIILSTYLSIHPVAWVFVGGRKVKKDNRRPVAAAITFMEANPLLSGLSFLLRLIFL